MGPIDFAKTANSGIGTYYIHIPIETKCFVFIFLSSKIKCFSNWIWKWITRLTLWCLNYNSFPQLLYYDSHESSNVPGNYPNLTAVIKHNLCKYTFFHLIRNLHRPSLQDFRYIFLSNILTHIYYYLSRISFKIN